MKKKIWLVSIVLLLITMLALADTYGLFETNALADSEMTIGKWKIMLNDVDTTVTQTITLDDFIFSANAHTDDGYFAPGRNVEALIEIDASLCDVSVDYLLSIDDSQIEDYPNIYISIEDMDTGNIVVANSYQGTILLGAASRVKILKLHLNWVNDSEYDESDTSLIGESINFVMSADFKQYLGS